MQRYLAPYLLLHYRIRAAFHPKPTVAGIADTAVDSVSADIADSIDQLADIDYDLYLSAVPDIAVHCPRF